MSFKLPISFSILAGGLLLAAPADASRWDWRAYPNGPDGETAGQRRVGVEVSAEYLLVAPAPGVDPAQLRLFAEGVAKTNEGTSARTMVGGRVLLRVRGVSLDLLHGLADQLVTAGLAADVWPALTRSTGVGFTDDQLAVRFRGVPADAALKAAGVELLGATRLPGVYRARALDGDAIRAAWALAEHPDTVWAEPDLIRDVKPLGMPDDPELGSQWHLESADDRGDINANGAWAVTTGSPDVRIAIFDTGTDLDHPDLVDNIQGGFDAADNDMVPEAGCSSSPDGVAPSRNCPNQQPYRESHGTAVAGLSAARGGNGLLGTGVCPDCSLYPVRIIADGSFRSLSTAEAFRRAGEDGVSVINNSWGPNLTRFFPMSEAEREAFQFVTREARNGLGIPVLFAAGNDFFTPANANPYASHPEVITVAASTQKDDFACYSDYGTVISIAAPSQGCFDGEGGMATTDYVGPEGYGGGDFTQGFGGTSAACPVASGLAGLILSANPGLTAQQVKIVMQATAAKIRADKNPWQQQFGVDLAAEFAYDDHGFSLGFGYGRIDAAAAVTMARDLPPPAAGACGEGCARCVDDRCAPDCATDAECPGVTRCLPVEGGTACMAPKALPTDIGQPCTADCENCVATVDSQFQDASVCSASCPGGDDDCPFGFDCRQLRGGDDTLCIPGNQECGELWNEVRCQSQALVSGGGQDFCSCECIPGTPGACPTGFVCSAVFCQQTRNGILCQASSERESNYLPMCVPDPNFERPCDAHSQCGNGMFCIDGTCQPDHLPGGCDLCVACEGDGDCNEGESCVNIPTRGNHCLQECAAADECPGTSVCTDLPGPGPAYCVNENYQAKGFCPGSWRCEVEGRCFGDGDCDDGVACEENVCGGAPAVEPDMGAPVEPDAGVPEPDAAPEGPPDAIGVNPEKDQGLTGEDAGDEPGEDEPETTSKANDGCQVGGRGVATPWALTLPLLGLAAVRRRRKSGR